MRLRHTLCDNEGNSIQPTQPAPRQPQPSAGVKLLLRALSPSRSTRLTTRQRDQLTAVVGRRWQAEAACASGDPVGWYPSLGAIAPPQVFATCAACPVRRSCLAVALLWSEDGIWGGTTVNDRRHGYRLLATGRAVVEVLDELLDASSSDEGPDAAGSAPAAQSDTRGEAA